MKKPEDEMTLSTHKVSELVFGEFGVHIHKRTIQHEVATGKIDVSQLKPAMKGNFPALTFQHLSNAFESFINLKQLNRLGGDISSDKLNQMLRKCTKPALECDPGWFLKLLLKKQQLNLAVAT